MRQSYAPLSHHLDQVTGAELESEIPSYAEHDDFLVKVPSLEQILCRGRFRHSPQLSQDTEPFNSLHQNPSLSGLTAQTESYDASGNQIGNGTATYAYDARGRMSSAIAGGITTSYAVNAFGERIRKIGDDVPNGEVNEYVYDEQGHLLGEYNSTGGIVNETVYLGNTPVAILSGTGATVYSVSADWLDTPHIIQNASKQDVWTWDH